MRGYYRSNGTYVAPHWRSSLDHSYNNNWSVSPNVNPYTGVQGTRQPTWNDRAPSSNSLGGYSNSLGTPNQPLGGYNQPLGGYGSPLGR